MSIHQEGVFSHKRIVSLGACLAVSGMLLLPAQGIAQSVTLTDAWSTATIDLASSAGMNSWYVNGQNQLNQQWFWYRTGNGVAQSIDTISAPVYQLLGNNSVDVVYQNSDLLVEIMYTLTGGGLNSGSADMIEQIMVINQSGGTLDLNFYQYSNFNLLGANSDNVEIFGTPGNYNFVRQWNGSTAIQEAINAPSAHFAEAGVYDDTLNSLNGTAGLDLNGNLTAGPGNVTWALQWAVTLADGGEFDLTKDKSLSISVVPEPATAALAILGGLCLAGWSVRRRRS